jgi:hypothetical protein
MFGGKPQARNDYDEVSEDFEVHEVGDSEEELSYSTSLKPAQIDKSGAKAVKVNAISA